MIGFRGKLRHKGNNEDPNQYDRADRIPDIQGHRHQVATGFTQGRRANLHDPKGQGDLRYFAHRGHSSLNIYETDKRLFGA
jgi:hypothetical protein